MSTEKLIRLGVLVPSSNTALEPLTSAIISTIPNVSVHFSRFEVTEISLSEQALSQFDDSKIIQAAKLLQHAHVDVIGWSGTSSGWLGLEADDRLCQRIEEATGIKATTSVIGLCKILQEVSKGGARFGLVTPYLDEVQKKIVETFGKAGYEVVAESHLNRKVNVEFADITEEELDQQVADVVERMEDEPVKIVSTFCTNLRAAQRASYWENKYPGLIVADTVGTVIWDMLRIAGVDISDLCDWGSIFSKRPSKARS
ncbi:uncharacterized protein MYCFIDRAFT_196472 [Pseudocercospora fijiensis CIRAD86]|uniref:Asp/Glu/hydantoin racemase n=1 Tax=Pseudocercospora fijiensis (strain CIRAD86) TaxID=383855 RepID=M2YZP2_PSEFD|nr:uncharacterized protein MYCFIDRAFT_196472 [Pseudocercospora fijiensis CIRAD86]EME83100.1 hypothetical protein MYCFIDRAFT_196472 [Pseudocercospora fijiensis CIRAD86]